MNTIKIGDVVTWRKPSEPGFMYMGIGDCEVLELTEVIVDEPNAAGDYTVPGALIDAHRFGKIYTRQDWLTKEN